MATPSSRPDLRAPVLALLEQLVPAVKSGGEVALLALVEAVAGDRLAPGVRTKLDARGAARFVQASSAATFVNEGPETKIELKRFDLKIPKRLAGRAELHDDGVRLSFEPKAALLASKLLISIRFEWIELTSAKIHVKMEQGAFDQIYLLN